MMFVPIPLTPPAIFRKHDESTAEPTRLGVSKFTLQVSETSGPSLGEEARGQGEILQTARGNSFFHFLSQLSQLVADEMSFDEETVAPTYRSKDAVFDLLEGVARSIPIPEGILYPDGEGGMRIEWRSKSGEELERYVLLSVHPQDERQDYIYVQQGSRRGDIYPEITAGQLTQRLSWLAGSAK